MGILRRIRRRRALAKGGFTLLELVVVLAIMGIMLAAIAPNLSRTLARERLDSAAYQLHSDLRLAQAAAKREQCVVSLSLYPVGKTQNMYIIRLQRSADVSEQVVVKTAKLPSGVAVAYTGDTLVSFSEDGHIMENGHITLYQGQQWRYLYYYQTGRVRISAEKNE